MSNTVSSLICCCPSVHLQAQAAAKCKSGSVEMWLPEVLAGYWPIKLPATAQQPFAVNVLTPIARPSRYVATAVCKLKCSVQLLQAVKGGKGGGRRPQESGMQGRLQLTPMISRLPMAAEPARSRGV
jgi:hypothetical protein